MFPCRAPHNTNEYKNYVNLMLSWCRTPAGDLVTCALLVTANNGSRINKFIKNAGSVIGLTPDSLEMVLEERIRRRIQTILQFEGHPLFDVFSSLKSVLSARLKSSDVKPLNDMRYLLVS